MKKLSQTFRVSITLKETKDFNCTHTRIRLHIRMSHITPFFELSLVLLTTKALGLYEFTKKIQRYRPKIEVQGKIFVFALFTREKCLLAKSAHFRTKKMALRVAKSKSFAERQFLVYNAEFFL